MAYKEIERYTMLQSKVWNMENGYKGNRLQWAQTFGKEQAEAQDK